MGTEEEDWDSEDEVDDMLKIWVDEIGPPPSWSIYEDLLAISIFIK